MSPKGTDSYALLGNPNKLKNEHEIKVTSRTTRTTPTTTRAPVRLLTSTASTIITKCTQPKTVTTNWSPAPTTPTTTTTRTRTTITVEGNSGRQASNRATNLIAKMINDVSKTINNNNSFGFVQTTRGTTTISGDGGADDGGGDDFPKTTTTTTTATVETINYTTNPKMSADVSNAINAEIMGITNTTNTTNTTTTPTRGLTVGEASALHVRKTTTATSARMGRPMLEAEPATGTRREALSLWSASASAFACASSSSSLSLSSSSLLLKSSGATVKPTLVVKSKSTENKCTSNVASGVSDQRVVVASTTTCQPLQHGSRAHDTLGADTRPDEKENTKVRCETEQHTTVTLSSLAKRKAQLKADFFRAEDEVENVNFGRVVPTKRKNPSLKLKIYKNVKEVEASSRESTSVLARVPKEIVAEGGQTTRKLSLVAQRKLDLKRKFEKFEQPHPKGRTIPNLQPQIVKIGRNFPSITQRVHKFESNRKMIVPQEKVNVEVAESKIRNSLKPDGLEQRNSPLSDEGCNLGQSPYSTDDDEEEEEEDNQSIRTAHTAIEHIPTTTTTTAISAKRKDKVARSASSDSALGLEVDEPMEPTVVPAQPPPAEQQQKRRMTLTVTDLPLRPALLPLAEPTALPDSSAITTTDLHHSITQSSVPSKVLLEERVVEIPGDPRPGSCSRRESAQSCFSDYPLSECGAVRIVRTPSVVVSDYSDDVMCGITLEEIEYFRAQRLRHRRSSLDTAGNEKDAADAASDVSAASSCSNLNYCGSTISALDGSECLVNGTRIQLERKISDCSTCSISGDEDGGNGFNLRERPSEEPSDLADMLACQHLSSKRAKKVGKLRTGDKAGRDKLPSC